jgi:hypothetical protein
MSVRLTQRLSANPELTKPFCRHDYFDEAAIQILSHIASVMKPGMKLLICEDLVPTAESQIGSEKILFEPGDYKRELIGINNDHPYQARSLPPVIPKVNDIFRATLDMDIVSKSVFHAPLSRFSTFPCLALLSKPNTDTCSLSLSVEVFCLFGAQERTLRWACLCILRAKVCRIYLLPPSVRQGVHSFTQQSRIGGHWNLANTVRLL